MKRIKAKYALAFSACVLIAVVGSHAGEQEPAIVTTLKKQCAMAYATETQRQGVPRMTGLHLWSASEAALRTLSNAKGIEELEFVATDLRTPAFNGISNLISLKSLTIVNCKFLPAQLAAIQNLTELQNLEITFTVLEESKETRAKLLGALSPEETQIRDILQRSGNDDYVIQAALLTDRVMPCVGRLTKLKTLQLANTFISPVGLEHLRPLVELESVNIIPVSLTGKTAMPFQAMTKLRSLRYFDVDDKVVEVLSKNTNLEYLDIWSGDMTDIGASHLAGLRKLQRLEIRGNKMTDEGLQQFRELPELTSLDLGYAKNITTNGIAQFLTLRPDVTIKYRQN